MPIWEFRVLPDKQQLNSIVKFWGEKKQDLFSSLPHWFKLFYASVHSCARLTLVYELSTFRGFSQLTSWSCHKLFIVKLKHMLATAAYFSDRFCSNTCVCTVDCSCAALTLQMSSLFQPHHVKR